MTDTTPETGGLRVKRGLAEMLKGGVIMDVTTAEQARIAEDAGAVAVMALERVPADIRAEGGVVRMADPYCYRCPFGREPTDCAVDCADELETTIRRIGPQYISAFILEPAACVLRDDAWQPVTIAGNFVFNASVSTANYDQIWLFGISSAAISGAE